MRTNGYAAGGPFCRWGDQLAANLVDLAFEAVETGVLTVEARLDAVEASLETDVLAVKASIDTIEPSLKTINVGPQVLLRVEDVLPEQHIQTSEGTQRGDEFHDAAMLPPP